MVYLPTMNALQHGGGEGRGAMVYTFPYDRRKLSVFAVLSVVGTAAAAALFLLVFVREGEAAQVVLDTTAADMGTASAGLFGILLFGGLAITAARFLLRAGPVLTIDEHGILDRRWGRRIPWAQVRAVQARGRGIAATFALAVDRPERFDSRPLWRRVACFPLGLRRNRGREVTLPVGALACRSEDVALAIEACGGVPVQRRLPAVRAIGAAR